MILSESDTPNTCREDTLAQANNTPQKQRSFRLFALLLLLAVFLASCTQSSAQAEPTETDSNPATREIPPTPTPTPLPLVVSGQSGRFEILLEVSSEFMQLGNRSTPAITGAWDAEGTSIINVNLQQQLGALETIISNDEDDLELVLINTPEKSYGHGPFAGATRDAFKDPESESIKGHPMKGPLVDTVTRQWGHIDHAELGEMAGAGKPIPPLSLLGIPSLFDPHAMLDALYTVTAVQEVGTSEVRGIETTVYAAEVPATRWIRLLSGSPIDIDFGQRITIQEDSAVIELEFYIDAEGNLHRIRGRGTAVTMQNRSDLTEVPPTGSLADGDISVLLGSESVDLWLQIDLFDHGSDVDIELPKESVDVAYLFEDLFELINR